MKTRFIIFILSFASLSCFDAKSQEGFSVGIKGGVGYSQYYFVQRVEQDFVQLFQKGLIISNRDNQNFGVQLEVLQTQKAWEEKISANYKKRYIIDYYEFPILSSYKFGKRKSGLLIIAGLHVSFSTKADSLITGEWAEGDTTLIPYSCPLHYSSWDYGLRGGLGYQLVFGRSIFNIEFIYSQGLRNLFDRNYTGIYRSLNQNLFMNLGYKFSFAGLRKKKKELSPKK